MSGRPIRTDYPRRFFLKQLAAMIAIPGFAAALKSCVPAAPKIPGGFASTGMPRGHMLRSGNFPEPSEAINCKVLIAGGGISGLSARRYLSQQGIDGVLMVEMEDQVGGNSIGGANKVSAFPWAAHYLPIPDPAGTELIRFLREAGIVTGMSSEGLPVYDEYALCHDPEERLFINGTWQDGLVPQFGLSSEALAEIDRFFTLVATLRQARGADGKFAFAIPLDDSSADPEFRKLDDVSFATYLNKAGFRDPHLLWYLEYCCKDDYGSLLSQTSAWAGLHYFAGRRGAAANAPGSAVLTWPEGNACLARKLREAADTPIRSGYLVYKVTSGNEGVRVLAYDCKRSLSVSIQTDQLILATPQYVNKHLFPDQLHICSATYAPWVVANITLNKPPFSRGVPLSWDNVIYGQASVGYVFANHQHLHRSDNCVLTFYLPFPETDASRARETLSNRSFESLSQQILNELSLAHPDIASDIVYMELRMWGHGMVRPSPGYIWGSERAAAQASPDPRIHFAHTDLSGISIFEEAFYQGIRAAQKIPVS